MTTIIRSCRLIDPSQDFDGITDIMLEGQRIKHIAKNISKKSAKEIDAKNKIVMPGLVDMHTHLREPGEEGKETIATGAKAALYGGFTTVCAMPNTTPPCDSIAQLQFVQQKAKKAGKANVLPVATITKDRAGKNITEMYELKEAGCLAVSDDGCSVANSGLLRRAMEYAAMTDLLVIEHCEDRSLVNNGVMHEGYWSTILGLNPIPAESESIIVERNIQLAALTGARLHIAHVSSAKSVKLIRAAKKTGVRVTAEVTPHHFTLTDESLKEYDTNYKVNPPLKTKEDIKEIKKGLKDGTIDVIATDHAPHSIASKEREFDYAPFGMIGLETALSISIMELITTKQLTWSELANKLSCNPCRILKYDRGTLKENAIADLIIVDPNKVWAYQKEGIKSLSSNSPFLSWKLTGVVTDAFVAGKHLIKNNHPHVIPTKTGIQRINKK